MKTSESILKISPAVVAAQSSIETVIKNGKNTFFTNKEGKAAKYATLDAIIEATRKPLKENKLAVMQSPVEIEGRYFVVTRLQHESGEFMEFQTPCLLSQHTMQQFGSAITYAKRYALASLLNISTDEDDDGNATQPLTGQEPKQQQSNVVTDIVPPEDMAALAHYVVTKGNKNVKGKALKDINLKDLLGWLDYFENAPSLKDKQEKLNVQTWVKKLQEEQ